MEYTQKYIEAALCSAFENFIGGKPEVIAKLMGDASARSIYRLSAGEIRAMGVFGPDLLENRAFLGFTRTFRRLNLPAPEIYWQAPDRRYYLLEDLGDITLFRKLVELRAGGDDFPREAIAGDYREAVRWLAKFQMEAADEIDYNLCYQTAEFDNSAWEADQRYFLECFVKALLPGFKRSSGLEREFREHRKLLEKFPRCAFLYRDFQSRNIMVTPTGLRFIDYQAGRKGFPAYDIAALVYDARACLPQGFREELISLHAESVGSEIPGGKDSLLEAFNLFALLRILQALGSYGNNGILKGKKEYLASIPLGLCNALGLLSSDPRLKKFTLLYEILSRINTEKNWGKPI